MHHMKGTPIVLLSTSLVFSAWSCGFDRLSSVRTDEDDADVIITATSQGEPAHGISPEPSGPGGYVVLTTARPGQPYYEVARKLAEHRKSEVIVSFRPGSVKLAVGALKQFEPDTVAVVLQREDLDINLVHAFLTASTTLDDDPFVDFAYGFLTAGDAGKAMTFLDNILRSENIMEKPRRVTHAGILSGDGPWERSFAQRFKTSDTLGFEHWSLHIVDTDPDREAFLDENIGMLEGNSLLFLTGHGSPLGVADGYSGRQIVRANLDLFPAVVVCCACYTGTVHTAYRQRSGYTIKQVVDEDDSFALAILHGGATGYYAGVGSWHGLLAMETRDMVYRLGLPCGETARRMYNRIVLARGKQPFEFDRMEVGAPADEERGNRRVLTASSMVFFGDPALQPFGPERDGPFRLGWELKDEQEAVLHVTKGDESSGLNPFMWRHFYAADGDFEAYIIAPLPEEVQRIHTVALKEERAGRQPAAIELKEWLQEEHGGASFLHAVLLCNRRTAKVLESGDFSVTLKVEHGR
jgi:hypothetical protein